MRLRDSRKLKGMWIISRTAVITLLALAAAVVGAGFANSGLVQSAGAQENAAANADRTTQLSGAYLTWVDGDVRWIIRPEERSAYVGLTDNAERLEFIKQFWVRRNPTPGGAENTFKEEHYRRIAYANVHFAAGMAGWMSDRGRIYIVNGRPDSIDSHAAGGPGETKPYEVWQYGGTQMKFVDRCACGDYELQTPPGQ